MSGSGERIELATRGVDGNDRGSDRLHSTEDRSGHTEAKGFSERISNVTHTADKVHDNKVITMVKAPSISDSLTHIVSQPITKDERSDERVRIKEDHEHAWSNFTRTSVQDTTNNNSYNRIADKIGKSFLDTEITSRKSLPVLEINNCKVNHTIKSSDSNSTNNF